MRQQKKKNDALKFSSEEILKNSDLILKANVKDVEEATSKNLSKAVIERLKINENNLKQMVDSLITIAEQDDPIGNILEEWVRPNGLKIRKISTPIGVIGIIYESRPNVTVDAGALCLKSGNASILRPGSESFNSAMALHSCLKKGIEKVGFPASVIQIVPVTNREAVKKLLHMREYVDVIVPRGGKSLIELVQDEAKVAVFSHLEGIVHIFIDKDADPIIADAVVKNSKLRRPGICGAVECLIIHQKFIEKNGRKIIEELLKAGVEVRVDTNLEEIPGTIKAKYTDWGQEFLDKIIAACVVKNFNDAVVHIQRYGSSHTDGIITNNDKTSERFCRELDSAILMINASTQFADGGEFGMGAEIGISTGKLHARGPVGTNQLTSFKYLVKGKGTIRG
jgi:glutamate-5-semialdehyde dehydrogenase